MCGTPDDIIMKAIGQDAGAEANGIVVSQAAMGLVAGASGRTGVALIALSAPLMALANADMASHGLVGRAGAAGFGGRRRRQHPIERIEGIELRRVTAVDGGASGTGQFHSCEAGCGFGGRRLQYGRPEVQHLIGEGRVGSRAGGRIPERGVGAAAGETLLKVRVEHAACDLLAPASIAQKAKLIAAMQQHNCA